MQAVTTIGLDIAKSVFQVHCVDVEGNVILRRQLKRRYVLAFFQKLPPCRCNEPPINLQPNDRASILQLNRSMATSERRRRGARLTIISEPNSFTVWCGRTVSTRAAVGTTRTSQQMRESFAIVARSVS
jgi:hypothetical protein